MFVDWFFPENVVYLPMLKFCITAKNCVVQEDENCVTFLPKQTLSSSQDTFNENEKERESNW